MNLKQSMGRRLKGHAEQVELNLTAVMNVFLILIPFLLLTAVFVRIAILELSMPNLNKRSAESTIQTQTVILNFLIINKDGFEVKSPDLKFKKLDQIADTYNWEDLKTQLNEIKQKHPSSGEIFIQPDDAITYDIIIQAMDHCRDSGFPNISISG